MLTDLVSRRDGSRNDSSRDDRSRRDRSCDDPQGQGEDTILTSNPNQEPEVLTHSGYYRYLEACMFTDPHCVDHVLHLCDMWESQLSSKPIYTGYTKYSLDYERDLLRVTQLYGAAAPPATTLPRVRRCVGASH